MRAPLVFLITAFLAWVAAVTAAEPTAADRDYAAFQELSAHPPAVAAKDRTQILAVAEHGRRVREAGLTFLRQHASDPRRWELVTTLAATSFYFVKPAAAAGGAAPALEYDGAADLAWREQLRPWQLALVAAPEATPAQRGAAEWALFERDLSAAVEARKNGEPQARNFAALQVRFEEHVARYGDQEALADHAGFYLYTLDEFDFGSSAATWRRLLSVPAAVVRERAAERLAELERLGRPQDLVFTAVDGRAVDLAQLRGKVVLLDFWATWCGPCVAELPNVKKVYAAYHERGFEVIGLTLEDARLAPTDSPEQVAAKLEKAKRKLVDFVAQHELPWPQSFEGRNWKGEIPQRYNVSGIPAMFLLDQTGRVVVIEARGPRLESEVRRLLKL